jgi:Lon protease-like protein
MDLPLFPLHTVLCPGIALPLHVFEPRYRRLVERSLADGSSFGIVLIREGREVGATPAALARVGTIAEIRESEAFDDGRFEILVVGTERFVIDEATTGEDGYLIARVAPLPDRVDDQELVARLADRVSRRFVDYLRLLQPAEGEESAGLDVQVEVEVREVAALEPGTGPEAGTDAGGGSGEPVVPDDPTTLSHLLSGIIQVELPQRQALLESATTDERLLSIDRLLDRELPLLARRLRVWSADPRTEAVRRN